METDREYIINLINSLGFQQRSNMGSMMGTFFTMQNYTGCFHICINYNENDNSTYFDFYFYPGAQSDIEVRSDYIFASASILKNNTDDIEQVIMAIADPETFALCINMEWFQDIFAAYYRTELVYENA